MKVRSRSRFAVSALASVTATGLALSVGACSGTDDGPAAAAGSSSVAGNGAGGTAVGGSSAIAGANSGGSMTGGSTSVGGSGNAAGSSAAGGTESSAGSNVGGAQSGGSATGGGANGPPTGVAVTTKDFAVPNGVVFNVADDYFNDGLIPATPVANFGTQSQITAIANDDGSLDVAWLDYTNGKGRPWAVNSASPIYITHIDAALGTAVTKSTGINSYKLLGFTKDAAGAFYVAYNKDHAFKSTTDGNQNKVNGNELHVVKLTGDNNDKAWDTLIFGDKDNNQEETLGDPGGASSGVLGYDAMNQKLVIYVGHSMMWDTVRHQAGFLRLLNPSSGAVQNPAGNDIIHFGAGWWYSHNFNQRLIVDGGNYYVLAHGDAYSRQLGFARWSPAKYASNNATDFDESYFKIAGNTGDNKTDSQTGQFVKMPDGKFLIVHTTSQGRSARDVRLVFASGTDGKAQGDAVWLTTNQGTNQATMPKVELFGDKVLVTYAVWDSSKGHQLTWYAAVLDTTLKTIVAPKALAAGVEFVDAAPLFRFKGGPNQGQVGWVSGNASHTLSVRIASLTY